MTELKHRSHQRTIRTLAALLALTLTLSGCGNAALEEANASLQAAQDSFHVKAFPLKQCRVESVKAQ